MLLNCSVGKDLRVPWTARRSNQSILKEISPGYSLEGLTLKLKLQYFTWCEELNHWKRLWCWERLKAGGEGDDGGCDSWMPSPTQWTWVWANSRRWWRTRKSSMLQSIRSQRVRHNLSTEQRFGSLRYGQAFCLMLWIWHVSRAFLALHNWEDRRRTYTKEL